MGRLAVVAVAVIFLSTACGDDDSTPSTGSPGAGSGSSSSSSSGAAPAAKALDACWAASASAGFTAVSADCGVATLTYSVSGNTVVVAPFAQSTTATFSPTEGSGAVVTASGLTVRGGSNTCVLTCVDGTKPTVMLSCTSGGGGICNETLNHD